MMTDSNGRITQGRFSFLPDLNHEQIARQIEHAIAFEDSRNGSLSSRAAGLWPS